ncbi:NnrU family protein [Nereida sp. MMG025]|uniref:NnrU family protein n=1 Tax=Nereida sp. MMG025 TaxID=2909981 RepID=UPI001F2DC624|nr:NnrU family protein [Nereida sp. MMG025]MCF6445499.1 NnrU family protein [Nereida sp. MMG025]
MGYIVLIIGVLLWIAAHYFKRLMPDVRANMGDKGKGVVTALIVVSLLAMIFGYRWAPFDPVWEPQPWLRTINNALMVVAFYVYGASAAKGAKVWLGTKLRHPQLTGFGIWAVAHLLVNGDLASLILFGGLLAWAIGSARLINAAEGAWVVPDQAPFKKEIVLLVITVVLFTIVSLLHTWAGVYPFGG